MGDIRADIATQRRSVCDIRYDIPDTNLSLLFFKISTSIYIGIKVEKSSAYQKTVLKVKVT